MKARNIGRYQVKADLGTGGMSVVYLAHDPRFGRDVAIKMLPRSLQDQPNVRARFEREARVIAALEHPAIVPVYDFGEDEAQPFLVMRHMPGGSLADVLTYGRLNMADVVRITRRIGSALDEANERGIIHRDLKPGNILFDSHGDAFLTDFGIVKLYENDPNAQAMTGSVVLGTPAYMSPEQALGKPIDRRSDVYALGAVLYEMLTGVPPYKGPTSVSVAMKHVMEPVPNPREYRPDLPPQIVAVVEKAMAKEPDARFATAGELSLALEAAAQGVAANEPMMPPIVVRKKPKTTSGTSNTAHTAHADPDAPVPTTEYGNGDGVVADAQPASQRRGLGLAAAIGIAVVALAIAGVLLAISLPRLTGATTPPTATSTPTQEVSATDSVAATQTSPEATATNLVVLPPTPVPTIDIPPTATEPPSAPTDAPVATLRVVNASGGNVRTGPGLDFPIIGRLNPGEEVKPTAFVGSGENKWYVFGLPGGKTAWISATVVTPVDAELVNALPLAQNVPIAPTPTPSPTHTPSPTASPTISATLTPTPTLTPTATVSPTPIALPTVPTPTPSPVPPSPTPSDVPLLPTATPTATESMTPTP